jgi:hypothetical protein
LKAGGALPFSFVSSFGEVAARGGFDVVIGNPPWIRVHNLDAGSRERLRRTFDVYRESAWRRGSELAGAGSGFASQVDAAALFVERSMRLLRHEGIGALIVPAKLWRSLAGGGVRAYLSRHSCLLELCDLGSADRTFEAAVYPSVVVARRIAPQRGEEERLASSVSIVAHRDGQVRTWHTQRSNMTLDRSPGAPWLLIPPEVRSAFDRLALAGRELASTRLGRPLLGVKTGCNEAFVVGAAVNDGESDTVMVTSGERSDTVEAVMLRPVARGNRIEPWRLVPGNDRIVWTHDDRLDVLPRLPPLTQRWLGSWRHTLERRTDAKSRRTWWGVFRVEGANALVPRVVWADIGRTPRAAVIPVGDTTVPLNSCYVIQCSDAGDAFALAVILNSPVASAWLAVLAEPARGGYRRFLGWTMSLFPVPLDWDRARDILSPIGERAFRGTVPSRQDLNAAVLAAYGLEEHSLAELLEWSE